MPTCAILICGNRSNVTNFKSCGVTYHRFPKDLNRMQKWIEACGRGADWCPTQHSSICSSHFEEQCFQPAPKTRRLFSTAVPTLKLRLVFETPKNQKGKVKLKARKTIIKPNESRSIVERYKIQIMKYKKVMQAKNMHIKRLQRNVQRYRKKAQVMKNILTALKNENIIGEDHLWLVDTEALSR